MPRRTDILEHWRSRSTISQREFDTARRLERLYERAELGGHTTLDLERIPGGGLPREMPAESVVRARQALRVLGDRLGEFDFALVTRVVFRGQDIEAEKDDDRRYLARRVREALRLIAARFVTDDLAGD